MTYFPLPFFFSGAGGGACPRAPMRDSSASFCRSIWTFPATTWRIASRATAIIDSRGLLNRQNAVSASRSDSGSKTLKCTVGSFFDMPERLTRLDRHSLLWLITHLTNLKDMDSI